MSTPIGYDDLRAKTVVQVAKLMAAAAITAPKSGAQLFRAGKKNFLETAILDDPALLGQLAEWLRSRGKERSEAIWFRDAEAVDAILFIGLLPGWYPPNYDCGACGYATCVEFLHATNPLREGSANREFAGPVCNLRDIDLGVAVGSAAKTAALHSMNCRCQTRVATAARKLGLIHAEHAVALSLSMTHKAIGFDRRMPEIDYRPSTCPAPGRCRSPYRARSDTAAHATNNNPLRPTLNRTRRRPTHDPALRRGRKPPPTRYRPRSSRRPRRSPLSWR